MMLSRTSLAIVLVFLPVGALGCSKIKSLLGKSETKDAGTVAAASATATPSDEVCTVSERKVWATNANRGTGLTARRLGKHLSVGVGLGNKPAVLLFDEKGEGKLVNVDAPPSSELAKDIPSHKGRRDLLRVTPTLNANAGVTAYADYRDKYEPPERRRIACELVETRRTVLVFDGKPVLDENGESEDKPDAGVAVSAGAVARAARAVGRIKALGQSRSAATPATAPSNGAPPAATAAPVAAPAPAAEKKKPVREIRDCRTLIDDQGGIYGVGSELYGAPQADGSTKWSMRLFVAPNAGNGYYLLNSVPLPKQPKQLNTFEAPWGTTRPDGSIVLTTRYRGGLLAMLLSSEHKPTGRIKTYGGGWPTMPDLETDGDDTLIFTSQNAGSGRYDIHVGRVSGKTLPPSLDLLPVEGMGPSLAEPSFVMVGNQRWLGFHAGAKREAPFVIVPVDAKLARAGKSHPLTAAGSSVAESRLFPLPGGQILAVYIESSSGGDELASQVLTCQAKS